MEHRGFLIVQNSMDFCFDIIDPNDDDYVVEVGFYTAESACAYIDNFIL